MTQPTTPLCAVTSQQQAQSKLSLSSLLASAKYHLSRLEAGDRSQDHVSRLLWYVRSYEKTRQRAVSRA